MDILPEGESHSAQHYRVLVKLAKSESMGSGDLEAALREIAEAAAKEMQLARVNVWLYDGSRTRIHCVEHFDRASGQHSSGMQLAAADYPQYFRALEAERTIAAHDAHLDPRTRELRGYLDEHGITSLMDAPLHSRGSVIGIVCHEHVGPARTWTPEEQRLAGSLADLAALAVESAERRQAEAALRKSEARTREILTHALDAIVTVDEESVIRDWNPRAQVVFGWSREEAVGRTLFESIIPERDHERHRAALRQFLETGEGPILDRRLELTGVDKAGREFPVEVSVSPVRVDGRWTFSAFIHDISARVRAEQEIHELNARLEERVRERTNQLEAAVAQKELLVDELRANSIALAGQLRELEHKSAVIGKDLERAQVIQRALLPSRPPRLERVHVDALYRPGMKVGGDLYDVSRLDDGHIALYVADATGHGVSAAMLSVLFKQRLELCDGEGRALAPGEVLRRVNDRLCGDVQSPALFLTAAYALLDPATYELRAASAGHTPMLLFRADGESLVLERSGPALGIEQGVGFAEHRVTLTAGDRLLLYTDGLTEGSDASEAGGIRNLIASILNSGGTDVPEKLRALYKHAAERVSAATGGEEHDDMTLLLLEVGSGPSHLDNDPEPGSLPVQEPAVDPARARGDGLWTANSESETYVAVRGRGTWNSADAFCSVARAALGAGKRLAIDLTDCSYLDSAFLGTLHEIVSLGQEARVRLHRPRSSVRALFVELGLKRVLAATSDEAHPPPCEPTRLAQSPPARESHRRLLQAHETLCELSEENRARFSGVVESLREELGEP